jgi:hypothetical protein
MQRFPRIRLVSKLGWRHFVFSPVVLPLAALTLRNYRLRQQGAAPDQWYWADALLWHIGFVVQIW